MMSNVNYSDETIIKKF